METIFKIDERNTIKPIRSCRSGRVLKDADVYINLRQDSTKKNKRVGITIKEDIVDRLFKSKKIVINLAYYAGLERLYIMDSPTGYALNKTNNSATRYSTSLRCDKESDFYKYVGNHRLEYDSYNKAYYVEV